MAARRRTTAAVLFGVCTLALITGCSTDAPPPAAPTPSISVTESPAEPAPTVDPVAVEAPAPVVGDTVSADAVDTLRAEGVSVYVSPNSGGEGLVVEPGVVLPEVVVADLTTLSAPAAPADKAAFSAKAEKETALREEVKKAGLSVLFLTYTGDYAASGELTGSGYVVNSHNVANARAFFSSAGRTDAPTKAGALANAQPLLDSNPGITLIDLTN